ncbi:unnamed protein product [Camellia sinensis]
MEDSGAILCQISSLKDMLDQVNEEIEAGIQITREIESEIVKCSEVESALAVKESELMKMVYMLDFEISGLIAVTEQEGFTTSCLDFQRNIEKGQNDVLGDLLSEKQLLENEFHLLNKKNNALQNSMSAFVEEILEDLHGSNYGLHFELENGKIENEKLLKDINELKTTLLSCLSI